MLNERTISAMANLQAAMIGDSEVTTEDFGPFSSAIWSIAAKRNSLRELCDEIREAKERKAEPLPSDGPAGIVFMTTLSEELVTIVPDKGQTVCGDCTCRTCGHVEDKSPMRAAFGMELVTVSMACTKCTSTIMLYFAKLNMGEKLGRQRRNGTYDLIGTDKEQDGE